eukprot:1157924-Pelagomonas_calceolata.AAC.4
MFVLGMRHTGTSHFCTAPLVLHDVHALLCKTPSACVWLENDAATQCELCVAVSASTRTQSVGAK